ncbi:Scr1 family TA system antitoxin-like transcriptional regulator [Streptomyces hygroscopicus]|uniref:helix-turn-helix domain-containing protein n=1 Tax=Streptomyces hygroscopicus TaxID=1912 RepID=UPI00099E2140|nr:helix-turn-helix transcriptional regulator [Streptomyces hygroscopicus]GLV73464.1 transcriptional regulator [Streptomyces hygroscopicus subsp. hygroscopicus]
MELHDDEGRATPRTMLGRRLRRLREAAGLSQRTLAKEVGYPNTYISRVELGEQLPSEALVSALDAHFGTDGLFADLLELAQDASIPDYGRVIVSSEEKATRIQTFTSSLIPGLLQTEEYAYALFRTSIPGESEAGLRERIDTRMRRKRVFSKPNPPFFWAIMDEAALKRPIGGPKCMRDQIAYMLEAVRAPHITTQVLPFTQGEHPMLGGSLSLLTLHSGATIGYVESFGSGEPVESPSKILELTQLFDIARSKALPEKESLALIQTYLREHDDEDDS